MPNTVGARFGGRAPSWRQPWRRSPPLQCSPTRLDGTVDEMGAWTSTTSASRTSSCTTARSRRSTRGTRSWRRSRSATGEIIATGRSRSIKALAERGTKVINLRGRRVLPGLIDGHLHGMREGYHCWTQVVRLDLVTERAAALADVPGKGRRAGGRQMDLDDGRRLEPSQLDDPTIFTFDELNAAAPKNPLWITGSGVTGPRVNQAALDALGLTAGSPGVELGPDGRPTGPADRRRRARWRTRRSSPSSTRSGSTARPKCLADFIEEANSRGLTAWKDAGGNTAPWGTTGAINEGLHVEEGAMHLYRDRRPQRAHRLQRDEQLRRASRGSSRTRETRSASSATTCSGTWAPART